MRWNFADVWEAVADVQPASVAHIHGTYRLTWYEFDKRADGVAATLLGAGLAFQDKVAVYLCNGSEYLEVAFAALKVGMVPVNTNYRYRRTELLYLWRNADVAAVAFHGRFTSLVEEVRAELPDIRLWLHVDDGTENCPSWAVSFEHAASSASGRVRAPWARSGNDLILIYTGGTTGRPKGVMWQQDDLYRACEGRGDRSDADLGRVRRNLLRSPERPVGLTAPPFMHGTGFLTAATLLNQGAAIVTLKSRQFDAVEVLDTIERERVTTLSIVGDAFCEPIVREAERRAGCWDLSSLQLVVSGGAMWSAEIKERLLTQAPNAVLVDLLGSSEAGMARSVTSKRSRGQTARFHLREDVFVLGDDGKPVVPGGVGRLAVPGFLPIGYYKDPEKSQATFPVVSGVRCAIPGDYAQLEVDGSITLLGRGSMCINTGGEKVFPEEVEEVLKTHRAVRDALVIGIPDRRMGESIAALVELHHGHSVTQADLAAHTKLHLAGYKVPRTVLFVESVNRMETGKPDYAAAKRAVLIQLANVSSPSADPF
jgi:3-oxocholest-4-en-26-oate---CoA ligase